MSKNASSNPQARLCVPVCAGRARDLFAAVARDAPLADLVELRLDCLANDEELTATLRNLDALLGSRPRPLIFTFRPPEQGGHRALDLAARLNFWTELARTLRDRRLPPPDFVDLELDLLSDPLRRERLRDLLNSSRLICSHHDFDGVPADLDAIYEGMTKTPASVLKIAVRAREITDCLPVLRLLERARRSGREMIAVAMDAPGLLTRVLAPARGAFLTYGARDERAATAPGQVSAGELRQLYRFDRLSRDTQITGLVGSPVAHSLSPDIHNAASAARGLDGVYLPFEVRDVEAFLRRMAHPRTREIDWNLRGLSVTAPHKQTVIASLDSVADAAREIGAVNTIVVEGGELRGHNTDAAAVLAPLGGLCELRGARVAVVGAGGAARALLWSLRAEGAHATVFARDEERARAVAEKFGAQFQSLAGARFEGFDAVVNATPLGTRGARESETAATAVQLCGVRVAYDLVYNPPETRFMREARAAGCRVVVGGLGMLVAQAAAQFELWTNSPAPLEAMRLAAERRLSGERAGEDAGVAEDFGAASS